MRMNQPVLLSLAAGILAVVVVSGYLWWDMMSRPAGGTADFTYEVQPNKSFAQVARELQAARIIRNARVFSIYARLLGQRGSLRVGEYLLRGDMAMKQILKVLTSGRSISRKFTVAEGLNIFDIARAFESEGFGSAEEFLKLARDPAFAKQLLGEEQAGLEGYLFPETYQLTKFTGARDLISNMVQTFFREWQAQAAALPAGWTRHQVVTLASIVEKETGAPQERARISAIFHNRLEKGMRLQTDPTIIYGIAAETGKVPTDIRRSDILQPTAYNTYVISGLPPGPIANPGRESLRAAMAPDQSPYLYFVSRNDGTHVFSETLEQHNRAVREFQLNSSARMGKSWRDLNKPEGDTNGAAPAVR